MNIFQSFSSFKNLKKIKVKIYFVLVQLMQFIHSSSMRSNKRLLAYGLTHELHTKLTGETND